MDTNSQSRTKKNVFLLMALLSPAVILFALEMFLRLVGVGSSGRTEFIEVPSREEYVALNPEYVKKYFPTFQPSVPFTPFLQQKSDDSFRVVVLGGSSTAGFPYQFYHGFPRRLAAMLERSFTDRQVEVVNFGMSAVNSYTIWDLRNAVADMEPDAVVIYAGHNEYYGAFGVASTVNNVANWMWLKRLILRLKRTATYLLLEDILSPSQSAPAGEDRTMMAQVVREAGIDQGSDVYHLGVAQFEKNMADAIRTWVNRDVDVYIGTLVANLKDQPPLGSDSLAIEAYETGVTLMNAGDTAGARNAFVEARDLDPIRFRAPTAINDAIRSFTRVQGVTLVDLESEFRKRSSLGVEGDSLFTDHLHPNYLGYELVATVFFEAITSRESDSASRDQIMIDGVDEAAAKFQVARLKSGYPFQKKRTPAEENREFEEFVERQLKANRADDRLALNVLRGETVMPIALQQSLRNKKADRDTTGVLLTYRSLANWQPLNLNVINEAVGFSLSNTKYDWITGEIAAQSAHRNRDVNSMNALGLIELRGGHLAEAEAWLSLVEERDSLDRTMLFNLARLHVLKGDTLTAREYFNKFQSTN